MQRQLPVFLALTLLSLLIIGTVSSTLMRREPPREVSPTPDQSYPATWTPTPAPLLPPPIAGEDASLSTSGVIVALQPIPHGSEFLPGMIGRRDWPLNNIPPGTIDNEAETLGKVAQNDIVQGQVIVQDMLVEKAVAGGVPEPVVNYYYQAQDRRIVIYTGQIWLVVKDTQETIAAITHLVEEKGGYVSESSVYQASNNVLQGTITIRVPSDQYQPTLAELRALALQVQREESRSQDVTEEFTDQEARLNNLKAGEEALQQLLKEQQQGNNITDIANVQQKLAELRGQIEQTEGRLRYLSDQAFLSTIRIELIPEALPPTPTPTPTPLPGWSPRSAASEASQSLLFSLQQTANSLIWGIIFIPLILVYLIPLILVIWLIRWGWRRMVH